MSHRSPSVTPAVSVLIPAWNAVRHLPAALDGLLSQTFQDWEAVVVDDGSQDETPALLAAYAARDARIRPLHVEHGGIVHALNHGLLHVRGRHVARMDADDTCHPERLALQCHALDNAPHLGLVASRVTFGGDAAQCGGFVRYVDWTNSLLCHEDIALGRFRESPLVHPSVMFRRELIDRFGPYANGPFPEDYELWLRWLEAGVRMEKLPEHLLVWNDPPGRLTRTHDNYAEAGFVALRTRYLARWLCAHNPQHPDVWVIGAGKASRRRARPLCEHGIRIRAWVDIDPHKIGNIVEGLPVVGREAMPAPGQGFMLAFLAGHGAAEELELFLHGAGYLPGRDYLLAS